MSKFDSTSLPHIADEKDPKKVETEIQKMGLDLLDKLNKTYDQIALAIAAIPSSGPFAPLPQTAAGVGQWQYIHGGAGNSLSLPAGGTWAYFSFIGYLPATFDYASGPFTAGIAAGGTLIQAALGANYDPCALVWRIA